MADDIYHVRRTFAELVGAISEDNEDYDDNTRLEIKLTANDVTGSLGVWGINH